MGKWANKRGQVFGAEHHAPWRTGAALAALLALVVVLAGCSTVSATTAATAASTRTPAIAGSPTATAGPTTPPGPTPIAITDLGTFRQKLTSAFTSNTWSKVAPLLSPSFSFQGLNSGGARLVMPDSANDMRQVYSTQGPWNQSAQYEVNIHYCYSGGTPASQQIGFDGGNGPFILLGLERWQGYWVVAWGYEDPLGGSDGCSAG